MPTKKTIISIDRFQVFVECHGFDPSRASVVLVNGALATTTSFRQMTRFLREHFNVVLYDLPHSGQSRPHNTGLGMLSKEDEVGILTSLIDRFSINHVVSISWGGVANLLALSTRPSSLRSAVVGSFSPMMNKPMLEYVQGAKDFLEAGKYSQAAHLLNNTVGKHLPRLLKLYNHRYLTHRDESEAAQIRFHVDQILALDVNSYLENLKEIRVPVLFINGELDEYTSVADVRAMQNYIQDCDFVTVPNAGHFLEIENRAASDRVQQLVLDFLCHGKGSVPKEPSEGLV